MTGWLSKVEKDCSVAQKQERSWKRPMQPLDWFRNATDVVSSTACSIGNAGSRVSICRLSLLTRKKAELTGGFSVVHTSLKLFEPEAVVPVKNILLFFETYVFC